MPKPLSNNQIGDLLGEAANLFDDAVAQTKLGESTLKAARMAIFAMQMGILGAEEKESDMNGAIIDPSILPPSRGGC